MLQLRGPVSSLALTRTIYNFVSWNGKGRKHICASNWCLRSKLKFRTKVSLPNSAYFIWIFDDSFFCLACIANKYEGQHYGWLMIKCRTMSALDKAVDISKHSPLVCVVFSTLGFVIVLVKWNGSITMSVRGTKGLCLFLKSVKRKRRLYCLFSYLFLPVTFFMSDNSKENITINCYGKLRFFLISLRESPWILLPLVFLLFIYILPATSFKWKS